MCLVPFEINHNLTNKKQKSGAESVVKTIDSAPDFFIIPRDILRFDAFWQAQMPHSLGPLGR